MTRKTNGFSFLVLGMALLCSGVLQAQDGVTTYPGAIGFENPCNSSVVIVNGTNFVRVDDDTQDKARGRDHDHDSHAQVNVQLRFVGSGKDAAGHPYHAVLIAKGEFTAASTMYDLPFHSMWSSSNDVASAPGFAVEGTVRVFAKGETATGSSITQFETSCRAGEHDSDGDHDDSH